MKCSVIKDLLPTYADDLCSEETRKEIDEHLESCESCSELFENAKADLTSELKPLSDKEKIKPFAKIRKKMRKNLVATIILSVLILAILGFLGVLIVGQVYKDSGLPNFERIEMRYESKKLVKDFLDGDIDTFMSKISCLDGFDGPYYYEYVYNDNKVKIKELYDEYIKGKTYKIVEYSDVYNNMYKLDNSGKIMKSQLSSSIIVSFENDFCIHFQAWRDGSSNQFNMYAYPSNSWGDYVEDDEGLIEFGERFEFICNYYQMAEAFDRTTEFIFKWDDFKDSLDAFPESVTWKRFDKDCIKNIIGFMSDDTKIIDCYIAPREYDYDKNKVYTTFVVTAQTPDGKKAILKEKAYYEFSYKYDFDSSTAEVFGDFDEEKTEQFKNLFG